VTARLLRALAALCALGFVLTFVVALHTGPGTRADVGLFHHVYGNTALPVRATGAARTLLLGIDAAFLVTAIVMLAGLAALRRRVERAVAACAIVVCSVGSVELLKHGLPRADSLIPAGRPATFPSGHTSIAVSLGLALVLAAPSVLRPAVALVAAAYAAAVGLSVIVLGWHLPADVVGSFFICGFWAAAIASLMREELVRPSVSPTGAIVAAGATALALAVAALVASRHPAGVVAIRSARAVLATAAGLGVLSVALFSAYTPLVGEQGS
jgi:membrane-associated phospholipid phosphatase